MSGTTQNVLELRTLDDVRTAKIGDVILVKDASNSTLEVFARVSKPVYDGSTGSAPKFEYIHVLYREIA